MTHRYRYKDTYRYRDTYRYSRAPCSHLLCSRLVAYTWYALSYMYGSVGLVAVSHAPVAAAAVTDLGLNMKTCITYVVK